MQAGAKGLVARLGRDSLGLHLLKSPMVVERVKSCPGAGNTGEGRFLLLPVPRLCGFLRFPNQTVNLCVYAAVASLCLCLYPLRKIIFQA